MVRKLMSYFDPVKVWGPVGHTNKYIQEAVGSKGLRLGKTL